MQKIDVIFYDGKTSKGYAAVLTLLQNYWLIIYNVDGRDIEVQWLPEKIKHQTIANVDTYTYDEFPPQVVKCGMPGFKDLLKKTYSRARFTKQLKGWTRLRGWRVATVLTISLVAVACSLYFFLLPWIAGAVASGIPRSYEERLGEFVYNGYVSSLAVNDSLTGIANAFASQIDFETDYEIQITVVNSEIVNAFALPGGKIVVFDALLEKMNKPEQFAALLAHEVGHIKHRHSLKAMGRSLSGYLFISLFLGDASGITAVLIDNADALYGLRYSRGLERDADQTAVDVLEKNRISLDGLVELFDMLRKESISVPEFISTHPLTDQRVKMAKEAAVRQKNAIAHDDLNSFWKRIEANR